MEPLIGIFSMVYDQPEAVLGFQNVPFDRDGRQPSMQRIGECT